MGAWRVKRQRGDKLCARNNLLVLCQLTSTRRDAHAAFLVKRHGAQDSNEQGASRPRRRAKATEANAQKKDVV